MLDLHVHVLPGIDDGPRSLADALLLARALVDEGVRHVVATPHIYPGVFDNTLETIATAHATLDTALAQQQIPLMLSLGAEVRLCAEMLDWLAQGRLPFLGGQGGTEPVVLVELPDAQIPLGADRVLGALIDRGVTPLLAHPERNRAIAEQVRRIEPLVRLGCKLQVTAASLLGEFGNRAERAAQELLDAGWVEVVASDAHNLTGRRPRLGAARDWLTQRYGLDLAEALTEHNPARLARQGELAMQGADGLTLRDLPRGHSEPPAAQARPSLIDALLDLPGSAAAPARTAGPQFTANHTADPANEPLHGQWSLTDFTLEVQAAAAGLDADEEPPPHQDFAEWTLPMTESGELAGAAPAAARPPGPGPGPGPEAAPRAAAPVAAVEPTHRKPATVQEPPVLDKRVEPVLAVQATVQPLPVPPAAPVPRRMAEEPDTTAALSAWPAETLRPTAHAGQVQEQAQEQVQGRAPAQATEPSTPVALAAAMEPAGPTPSRWNLLGWVRSRKARSAAPVAGDAPGWNTESVPAGTVAPSVQAPLPGGTPPAEAAQPPTPAPVPQAQAQAQANANAVASSPVAMGATVSPVPVAGQGTPAPMGISLSAFDDVATQPPPLAGSRGTPPQYAGVEQPAPHRRAAAVAGTAGAATVPRRRRNTAPAAEQADRADRADRAKQPS